MDYARTARGFTLIEVLVALFILGVTAVSISVVAQTIKTTRDSAFANVASHIAENKLDTLRAAGYAALPAGGSFSDPDLASLPNGEASTSITDWNSKTKKIVASVAWTAANGATSTVSLTTLMTETGGL